MHVVNNIGAMLRNGTGWDEVQLPRGTRPTGNPFKNPLRTPSAKFGDGLRTP